ncbi:MAG: KpsF/GutQ family sugar-phosphate isomerase [Pseudomonadota bacterium]
MFNIVHIVSGIGKSGHIANKISATLASTGTPSFFVHPSEASHGDLGMVTKDDAVILLSNSGETAELKDFIYYTRRFSIPLIGIIRRAKSNLAKHSDYVLTLPDVAEASFLGAPTTSTTMMISLGDAMAIALSNLRDFKLENFNNFHPGGKLGKSFIKVKNLMHVGNDLPLIHYSKSMEEALFIMTDKKFGCIGITNDDDEFIGIITDGDLRRNLSNNIMQCSIKEVMTENPKIIDANSFAASALALMEKESITNLFCIDENRKVIGIIHIHDILKAGII